MIILNWNEFITSALPYFLLGIGIAIFFAGAAKKEKNEKEKKLDSYGMGILFGVAIGIAVGCAVDKMLLITGVGAIIGAAVDIIRLK